LDLTQTITNAVVVTAIGAIIGRMVQGLRTDLRRKLAALRTEFKGDMSELRGGLRDIRREVADMRSDLTQVALAVGPKRRASSE
jgi:hypothetical protein